MPVRGGDEEKGTYVEVKDDDVRAIAYKASANATERERKMKMY